MSQAAENIVWTEPEKAIWRRKPSLKVSEWAEKNRVVIKGPKQGPWSNDFAPYAVEPMDTFNDPWVRKIVLKWAPQTVKTSTALNMLMYAADYDPDDCLYIMPDEKMAKKMARKQIIPSLKGSPVISKLLSPRFDDVTTTHISFQNGMDVDLAWATSAAELAADSYRYLFGDETGKWPKLAGREGDPLYLSEIRTTAWQDIKKIVLFSSPNEEEDAITRAEKECDQIRVYMAKCPACGHLQEMKFRNYVWPDRSWKTIKRKRMARYQCEKCPIEWADEMRNRAVADGAWKSIVGETIQRPTSVAFRLPVYYSRLVSLSDTTAAYLQGKTDRAKMKIFVTQHKAQEWKEVIEKPEESKILKARCDLPPQIVPIEAIALSAGIDVQKYGFWFVVRAWARDFTNWLVHYGQLATWEDVENLLFVTYYPVQDSDRRLRIWRCGMDTGGGKKYQNMSMTEETYWWIRKNGVGRGGRVYATKGSSRPLVGKVHVNKPLDRTPSGKPLPGGLQLFTLDTEKLKDMIMYRLGQAIEHGPQASYLHTETGNDYARQISAEEKQRDKKGNESWVQVRTDNHLLDCECLAQIVMDPEWPGGGLNLLRISSQKSEQKKTSSPQVYARSRFITG